MNLPQWFVLYPTFPNISTIFILILWLYSCICTVLPLIGDSTLHVARLPTSCVIAGKFNFFYYKFQVFIWLIHRYEDEILRPHVVPYTAVIWNSTLLMHDSTGFHTTRLVENALEMETMQCMEWSVCSADFNPTRAYMWHTGTMHCSKVKASVDCPGLQNSLIEHWNRISQSLIYGQLHCSCIPWKTAKHCYLFEKIT